MIAASSQRGVAATVLVIMVAVIIAVVGAAYYFSRGFTQPIAEPTPLPPTTSTQPLSSLSGAKLAGITAPLLDFSQTDFETALASDKVIVLYFYANWCPICREEFPKMQAAFNELETSNVIGFRVNFNDNETDADEVALARQHGIAYQHTKVIVQNGRQLIKSSETWEKNRYLTELAALEQKP
jgi:thiol-disulfide isomerase/thioredoxin